LWLAVCALVSAPLSAPLTAWADQAEMSEEASARLQRGLAHYSTKNYEAAIKEFAEAYDVEPHPQFLYAWAQAERLSGDCPSAVKLYERFLESGPDESQASAATSNKQRCEEALGSGPGGAEVEPPVPVPVPAPTAPEPTSPTELAEPPAPAPKPAPVASPEQKPTTTEHPEDAPAPWALDPLAGTLLGLGLASAGVGVGLWVASASDLKTAGEAERGEPTETYGQHVGRLDGAQTKRTSGVILIAAGSTLAVAAVVRYIIVGTSEPERAVQPEVGAWLSLDGLGAEYGREF